MKWLKSYLTNRKQYVQIEEATSSVQQIVCGVPQGSVLGPKLFLIYINDIVGVSETFKMILFADDTNIVCTGENLTSLVQEVNEGLIKLHTWFQVNKLSLNIDKTKYILFGRKGLKENVDLQIDGYSIERVRLHKSLGVLMDDLLTWKPQVREIEKKTARNVAVIWRLKKN